MGRQIYLFSSFFLEYVTRHIVTRTLSTVWDVWDHKVKLVGNDGDSEIMLYLGLVIVCWRLTRSTTKHNAK